MAHRHRRFLGLISLAVYAVTVTFGGAFHDHGPQDPPGGGCPGHERCCPQSPSEPCGDLARGAAGDGVRAERSPSSWGDAGGCAVCHFLAQKTLPTSQVRGLSVASVGRESAIWIPSPPAEAFFSIPYSRGPPAVA